MITYKDVLSCVLSCNMFAMRGIDSFFQFFNVMGRATVVFNVDELVDAILISVAGSRLKSFTMIKVSH